jgi:transcriptional regulator with XRE-family HTH domain
MVKQAPQVICLVRLIGDFRMLHCMKVGDRIREARTRLGWSQRAFAAQIGVHNSAVAQWEGGGGGKGITLDNLIKAARVLQIKPSELLGEKAASDSFCIDDPREIALVQLFRGMPEALKDVHLRLLYVQAGVSEPPEQKGNPGNRKRISR